MIVVKTIKEVREIVKGWRKEGATIGFVKSGNNINEIKSNSLPVGVLDMVEPRITKTVLEADDILIMMSDGVVDAFSSIDEIKN